MSSSEKHKLTLHADVTQQFLTLQVANGYFKLLLQFQILTSVQQRRHSVLFHRQRHVSINWELTYRKASLASVLQATLVMDGQEAADVHVRTIEIPLQKFSS